MHFHEISDMELTEINAGFDAPYHISYPLLRTFIDYLTGVF